MGPADLADMIASLSRLAGGENVLIGPETADDAGVYRFGDRALVATADFITPVCDDPLRFGGVAAVNALSDIFAMGARPLFALNLCCFPDRDVPEGVLAAILEGAARMLGRCGAAVLGGHSVRDSELKFGLAVVGEADPERLLPNSGCRPGDRLVLTKPLGTGVLINAFKFDHIDAAALEPALLEMERLNDVASSAALAHGAGGATDITGFGLAGHALEMARASGVRLRIRFARLPVHERFYELVERGVSTGCTAANREFAASHLQDKAGLDAPRLELLHDPQTSGGLLISLPADRCEPLVEELRRGGHHAAAVGEVVEGPAGLEVI